MADSDNPDDNETEMQTDLFGADPVPAYRPDPDKVRSRLHKILAEAKAIAKDFASVLILDSSGQSFTGIIKKESAEKIDLMTAEGKLIAVKNDGGGFPSAYIVP